MRIRHSSQEINISYSLSSILYLFLFSSISYMKPKITLITGITIFSIGIINSSINWIVLACKLGICPGLYHSTLCIPTLKRDKINFKSSQIFEFGMIIGIIEACCFYLWINAKSSLFFLGINAMSFVGIILGKEIYLVSDFLGIALVMVANILITKYSFPDEYLVQLCLIIVSGRIILLNKFKDKLLESTSVSTISLICQGILLSALGYIIYGVGSFTDILVGSIYSLSSYVLLEAGIKDKSASLLSIMTLQIYAFVEELALLPVIISIIGLILLLIGYHLFHLFPIRMNSMITQSNNLSDSFL